jgi:glutathione S-transferase
MAVKLHRCSGMRVKLDAHPCWRVQKALDDKGVDYEVVKHPQPFLGRGRRKELQELTGQTTLPLLELEDGTMVLEESK